MNIVQVRKMAQAKVKYYGTQSAYAEQFNINKAKLSEFLSGAIDYVPSSLLKALELKAVPQPTIYRKA